MDPSGCSWYQEIFKFQTLILLGAVLSVRLEFSSSLRANGSSVPSFSKLSKGSELSALQEKIRLKNQESGGSIFIHGSENTALPKPPLFPGVESTRSHEVGGRPGPKPSRPHEVSGHRPPGGRPGHRPGPKPRPPHKFCPHNCCSPCWPTGECPPCTCGWNNNQTRIIGGQETTAKAYPMMGALRLKGDQFVFCGATLVTGHHALTAAHCIDPKGPALQLLLGAHNISDDASKEAVYDIEKVLIHENYIFNDESYKHDIALLVTGKQVRVSSVVGPACFPKGPMKLNFKRVQVMGWGVTEEGSYSTLLREVSLPIVPLGFCAYYFPDIDLSSSSQLCTYEPGYDSCLGDSGGPLLYMDPCTERLFLVGIVSYGLDCGKTTPGVNTDVTAYVGWVKRKIKDSNKPGKLCS